MDKKEKIIAIIFCIIFFLIITVIGVLTLFNNKEISEMENRTLKRFSDANNYSLLDEKHYSTINEAFSDQLAFKNSFVKMYYMINYFMNDYSVVKGKEKQLYSTPYIISNKKACAEFIENKVNYKFNKIVDELAQNDVKFIYLLIPAKDIIMPKYLPNKYSSTLDEYQFTLDIFKKNISNNVVVLEGYEILKETQNEYYDVFYSTDNHINIRGAYPLFKRIIEVVNDDGWSIKVGDLEDEYIIQKQVVNGAYNRQIGQCIQSEPEELNLIPKNINVQYQRSDNGNKNNTPIFGKGNTYASAYMNQDYGETLVTTNNYNSANIMYVGSSYTNVFEALSVYKFKTVLSLDYRYNTTNKGIVEYAKENDINYVVFVDYCVPIVSSDIYIK